MTSELMKAARWGGVQLRIAFGFLACQFYGVWPSWRGGWWNRIGQAVLPFAGYYAFSDDPWVRECDAYWIKTGRTIQASQGSGNDG